MGKKKNEQKRRAAERAAAAAGLGGITVEAGRALVLDRAEAIAEADRAGLFLLGLEPGEVSGRIL